MQFIAAAAAVATSIICIDKMKNEKKIDTQRQQESRDEPRVICFLCLHFSSLPKFTNGCDENESTNDKFNSKYNKKGVWGRKKWRTESYSGVRLKK